MNTSRHAPGCCITEGIINGWKCLRLSNSHIEVTVLPDKGADIYSFVDLASGVDVLMKTPWGLEPPGSAPRPESSAGTFLHNYEGAWQELFPNTDSACVYEGRQIPLHGEVATLPWAVTVERENADEVVIRLDVSCRQSPLALTRRMTVQRELRTLILDETVHNQSNRPAQFVWGHHVVVGAPFLEAGCRLHVAPCTVHTRQKPFDANNAAYASGQSGRWPYIQAIDGQQVDLREIPGREANIHDHACLTGFERGWVAVENPRLGLFFGLEWDPKVFRWINNWRPLGGSHVEPLEGIYGLALEPWATRSNLADAVSGGEALWVERAGTLSTSLRATLTRSMPCSGNGKQS